MLADVSDITLLCRTRPDHQIPFADQSVRIDETEPIPVSYSRNYLHNTGIHTIAHRIIYDMLRGPEIALLLEGEIFHFGVEV